MAVSDNIVWFGRYEGWLRWLCRGVRDGDPDCIDKAARLFALMLPDRCFVVPMPSHTGRADAMLRVARGVLGDGRMRIMCDFLSCRPHEPSYAQKKAGWIPDRIVMTAERALTGAPVYIIDNVVCTGVTAAAALEAFRAKGVEAKVCTLARAVWR